jgi:hypothetical protein
MVLPYRTVPSLRETLRLYPPGPCRLTTSVGLQGLFPRLPTPTTSNALPVPGTAWSFTLPSVSFTEALPGTRT